MCECNIMWNRGMEEEGRGRGRGRGRGLYMEGRMIVKAPLNYVSSCLNILVSINDYLSRIRIVTY